MTAAIFGLLGVIVGGVLNGLVTAALEHRRQSADQRSAARLVRSELVFFHSVARQAATYHADELPQLRNASTLLWQSNRTILARSLDDGDWAIVARAYAHVDALLSVLVFEPDGRLPEWRRREAARLLHELTGAVEEAARLMATGEERDDVSPFPEAGPVAV